MNDAETLQVRTFIARNRIEQLEDVLFSYERILRELPKRVAEKAEGILASDGRGCGGHLPHLLRRVFAEINLEK